MSALGFQGVYSICVSSRLKTKQRRLQNQSRLLPQKLCLFSRSYASVYVHIGLGGSRNNLFDTKRKCCNNKTETKLSTLTKHLLENSSHRQGSLSCKAINNNCRKLAIASLICVGRRASLRNNAYRQKAYGL